MSEQRTITKYKVTTSDKVTLPISRYSSGASPRASVLLVHGASAASSTFLIPSGRSLVDHLLEANVDVWLMDWRGSKDVVDKYDGRNPELRQVFDMDSVARQDFPAALTLIRSIIGESAPLRVFAHCLGSGCFSIAIALGVTEPYNIDRVVLSTLGLFFQAPWDGWLKVEDRILERLPPTCRTIDPRQGERWPDQMQEAFKAWPKTLYPVCGDEVCERLAFMFGAPYLEDNLADPIHKKELGHQFGAMHITLYKHAGQNLRRGFASPYGTPLSGDPKLVASYLNPGPFSRLRITLITGDKNALWHRDSIDRMYDWLKNIDPTDRFQKHVFPDYGHQDLLWGKGSWKDVFPRVLKALVPEA